MLAYKINRMRGTTFGALDSANTTTTKSPMPITKAQLKPIAIWTKKEGVDETVRSQCFTSKRNHQN